MSVHSQIAGAGSDAAPVSFMEKEFCYQMLRDAQNPDGGWGFRSKGLTSVEATGWALLAFQQARGNTDRVEVEKVLSRGFTWLTQAQLADGSWPQYPTLAKKDGCWVTALACRALQAGGREPEAVRRGVQWLCKAWPAEGGFWWRIRFRLAGEPKVVQFNYKYRGWSWTPGTSSWVEPTSHVLLLFREVPSELLPAGAAERRRLAEAMLYDRICPGGGWNCGNPVVYGVAGTPSVIPTVWALLALQDSPDRAEVQDSLQWLGTSYQQISSSASLALASLCLNTYGRPTYHLGEAFTEFFRKYRFLESVPVYAWVALALEKARNSKTEGDN